MGWISHYRVGFHIIGLDFTLWGWISQRGLDFNDFGLENREPFFHRVGILRRSWRIPVPFAARGSKLIWHGEMSENKHAKSASHAFFMADSKASILEKAFFFLWFFSPPLSSSSR